MAHRTYHVSTKQYTGLRTNRRKEEQVIETISNIYGTIAILHNQNAAGTG